VGFDGLHADERSRRSHHRLPAVAFLSTSSRTRRRYRLGDGTARCSGWLDPRAHFDPSAAHARYPGPFDTVRIG
jgi:hypothetical protein